MTYLVSKGQWVIQASIVKSVVTTNQNEIKIVESFFRSARTSCSDYVCDGNEVMLMELRNLALRPPPLLTYPNLPLPWHILRTRRYICCLNKLEWYF